MPLPIEPRCPLSAHALAGMAALLLSGCAQWPVPATAPVAVPAPTPAQQVQEVIQPTPTPAPVLAPAAAAPPPVETGLAASPATTLESALLLAQTRQPNDLARAQALLEPLAREGAPAPWANLARLLQARLADQRRLEEQADRQAQQLRDQQRRLEQLASQLEALKAIERSLATRPTPQLPPSAASSTRTP